MNFEVVLWDLIQSNALSVSLPDNCMLAEFVLCCKEYLRANDVLNMITINIKDSNEIHKLYENGVPK